MTPKAHTTAGPLTSREVCALKHPAQCRSLCLSVYILIRCHCSSDFHCLIVHCVLFRSPNVFDCRKKHHTRSRPSPKCTQIFKGRRFQFNFPFTLTT
ncbi:hypothetical protein HBI56_040450 [Parastagonospora nodorum]|uniref:Uncharacterized protein n=1 Tax=Phaeosphaeria nodorum (strain SN15 / ATCC MYA-4574 / FGSC 10173) TaxID=321614 RepID=A0A7U2HYG1_PHANO|nr:hypothetical protein HBH56_066320 [Parastagonospora nodorum]QRC93331.1 hypothetical protein JI435_403620 [Parastagonospora nodorum SN15]KAH3932780.1 hypothetical protein HBH54_081770 [Parastagonospora nodorum]KAH3986053.1 hypothetical protein HBH52_043810 [Parastagonospora nodorum]KAH3988381.1 hypothetical protein HBH51_005240 [Parastagonospora nodorum]